MVVLPVVKLGALALKTLSKPIASRIKHQASLHPKFRQLIINLAQANHRFTTTMQRRVYGHATNVEIRPLNEEKAVQAAVDLLGELFVFSVAGAAVIFEVQRSSRSEAKKEELRRQELEVQVFDINAPLILKSVNIDAYLSLTTINLAKTHPQCDAGSPAKSEEQVIMANNKQLGVEMEFRSRIRA